MSSELVLVTGGAGWLGRRLVHALIHGLDDGDPLVAARPGTRVRALVLPGEEAAVREVSSDVEVVAGDLRRPEDSARLCRDARGATLFHVAGLIHPNRVRELYEVNVGGTTNVLAAAVDAGVQRAVVMSSNSPLGCNPHPDHLFDEASPYHPYLNYGRSKMLMEQHVERVRAGGRIETVVIRAPWFYGPFQPARQTAFFAMVRDGGAPIVGDGENRRSMAYIDNLVQGLLRAARVPAAAERTYWIADERPYSMNEIVNTIERLLESEFGQTCAHKRLRLPWIAGEVALLCDRIIQAAGFYEQRIHVLSEMNKTIACSIVKARRELGYEPRVSIEEGMRRSLRWVVDQGLLPPREARKGAAA